MKEPAGSFSGDVKRIDLASLESAFQGVELKTQPREHQTRALFVGISKTGWLFALDMGLGKTKIALDIHTIRNKMDGKGKMLVLCPSIMLNTWRDETHKHSHHSIEVVESKLNAKDKVAAFLNSEADILVCSITWFTHKMNSISKKEAKQFQKVIAKYDRLIIDEGHKLMNHKSAGFRVCVKFLLGIRCRYILTGTPVSNNPTGIWALYYLIDKGETFGSKFYEFLDEYFRVEMVRKRFPRYFLLDEYKEDFYKAFWSKAIRWTEDDCSDLPDKQYIKLKLDMTTKQSNDYDKCLDEGGNLQKLLRITGGSDYKDNPKIEALSELLQQLVIEGNKQVIVWAWMIAENEVIMELCDKLEIKAAPIRGGISPDQKNSIIDDWRLGKIRVIVANQKSLGVGVTLTESHICIFYSNNASLTDRKQSEKRIHRTGQTVRCAYIDLACRQSADTLILRILEKANLRFDDMLDSKIEIEPETLLEQRLKKK